MKNEHFIKVSAWPVLLVTTKLIHGNPQSRYSKGSNAIYIIYIYIVYIYIYYIYIYIHIYRATHVIKGSSRDITIIIMMLCIHLYAHISNPSSLSIIYAKSHSDHPGWFPACYIVRTVGWFLIASIY